MFATVLSVLILFVTLKSAESNNELIFICKQILTITLYTVYESTSSTTITTNNTHDAIQNFEQKREPHVPVPIVSFKIAMAPSKYSAKSCMITTNIFLNPTSRRGAFKVRMISPVSHRDVTSNVTIRLAFFLFYTSVIFTDQLVIFGIPFLKIRE